jgi:hypothetical protein
MNINEHSRIELHEAGEHFRQASVEILKGVRQLLDAGIQALSRESHPEQKKPVEVPVE